MPVYISFDKFLQTCPKLRALYSADNLPNSTLKRQIHL